MRFESTDGQACFRLMDVVKQFFVKQFMAPFGETVPGPNGAPSGAPMAWKRFRSKALRKQVLRKTVFGPTC